MKLYVDIEKQLDDFKLMARFETDGEVFAVLGASGCGKTMTVRCIAGIERPDRGVIKLGDRVLFDSDAGIDVPARKRRIGYLFQDYALFPHMTVFENIACGCPSEDVTEYVEKFYLTGKEALYPHQLSGGEKQRTAIARMLAASPDLIMFDEPFSALDSHLKSNLEGEILAAADALGGQALFVSHDRDEVYRLTDRIAVMDKGYITEIKSKGELFTCPSSMAAAMLVGYENFTAVEKLADGLFYAEDWGMRIRCDFEGEAAIACLRAEDFKLAEAESDGGDGSLEESMMIVRPERILEDIKGKIIRFRSPAGCAMTLRIGRESRDSDRIKEGQQITVRMPRSRILMLER